MNKDEIKEKCDAYRNMVKAEAKFFECKENYYLIKNKKSVIEISDEVRDVSEEIKVYGLGGNKRLGAK